MKIISFVFAALCPLLAAAAPEALVVNPAQSRVEIDVKATVDSFTGKLSAYDAAITVDAGRVSAAKLAFHFADLKTGKDGRDEAMLGWLETKKTPDGLFVLGSLDAAAGGRSVARGVLTLHGVAREISFPVSVTKDQALYAIDGEASLDTRDFGLPVIRKFGLLKVDPVVKVRFHLQGAIDASKTPAAP